MTMDINISRESHKIYKRCTAQFCTWLEQYQPALYDEMTIQHNGRRDIQYSRIDAKTTKLYLLSHHVRINSINSMKMYYSAILYGASRRGEDFLPGYRQEMGSFIDSCRKNKLERIRKSIHLRRVFNRNPGTDGYNRPLFY